MLNRKKNVFFGFFSSCRLLNSTKTSSIANPEKSARRAEQQSSEGPRTGGFDRKVQWLHQPGVLGPRFVVGHQLEFSTFQKWSHAGHHVWRKTFLGPRYAVTRSLQAFHWWSERRTWISHGSSKLSNLSESSLSEQIVSKSDGSNSLNMLVTEYLIGAGTTEVSSVEPTADIF